MRGEPRGAAVRASCERSGCARQLPAGGSVELWKAGNLGAEGIAGASRVKFRRSTPAVPHSSTVISEPQRLAKERKQ